MAWMDEGREVKGGVLPAAILRVVPGESLFVGDYQHLNGGSVPFSPALPGAVRQHSLRGDSLILTAGSFMACAPGIHLGTRFDGLGGLFSGDGGFFIECKGKCFTAHSVQCWKRKVMGFSWRIPAMS